MRWMGVLFFLGGLVFFLGEVEGKVIQGSELFERPQNVAKSVRQHINDLENLFGIVSGVRR